MRIKNDTILKTYLLIDTMNLTNEEFGLLVRNIMMSDDRNELRYEHMEGFILKAYMNIEEKWKNDFEESLRKNPQIISAYATMNKQVSHSHDAFLNLQNYYDNKKDEDNEKEETPKKPKKPAKIKKEKRTFKFEDGTEMAAFYEKSNEANLFTEEEFEDLKIGLNQDMLLKIIKLGNLDGWKCDYQEYLAKVENEDEGPF